MNKLIYDLLFFIKNNNNVPSAKDLNIDESTLISVIKRCLSDGLLDKKILYVNILGQIQCMIFQSQRLILKDIHI